MTVGIVTGMEKLYNIMIGCLEAENTTNGLLEDVETIINSYYNESQLEEPIVWVTQHPATANRQADLSQTMELTVPFEFDCGVYEADLEASNLASQNLANRVIMSILNNWQTIQATELPGQRLIRNITLQTYSPVGYVNVTNKSEGSCYWCHPKREHSIELENVLPTITTTTKFRRRIEEYGITKLGRFTSPYKKVS